MRQLRHLAIVIALAAFVPLPAHAVYICQIFATPSQEARNAGAGFLNVVSQVYSTIAMLENEQLTDATSSFTGLAVRLRDLAVSPDFCFEDPSAASQPIDLQNIGLDTKRRLSSIWETNSYANLYFSSPTQLEDNKRALSQPQNRTDVYAQSRMVVERLADHVQEAQTLSSQESTISDLLIFRRLHRLISEAVDILALHSILLSAGWEGAD